MPSMPWHDFLTNSCSAVCGDLERLLHHRGKRELDHYEVCGWTKVLRKEKQ